MVERVVWVHQVVGSNPATLIQPSVPRKWFALSHRQLSVEFETLRAVGERPSDPGLKARVVVGDIAASWKPGAEEPLEGAEFEVDPAADFDLGD